MKNIQQPAANIGCPSAGGRMNWVLGVCLLFATNLAANEVNVSQLPLPATNHVDFTTDIKPILDQNCLRCHGESRSKGGFRLDNYGSLLKGGDSGVAVRPGNSTNSLLIHLVAQIDPNSVMPPEGSGDPLTSEQVGLLRAWIDQGAWWTRVEENPDVNVSLAPALGFVSVSGNDAKFREQTGLRESWRTGVESFEFSERLSPQTKYTFSGRALTDDYRADLLIEKQQFGFVHSGFQQFRKYYSDTGGYVPGFNPSVFSLNRNLHMDEGRAWLDLGLALPDWPRFVLGYEYQYRNGEKSTLQWGLVGTNVASALPGPEARLIYPAYKVVDEHTHVLKLDVDYTYSGWRFEDNFRGEWTDLRTRQENVVAYDINAPNSALLNPVSQGWKSFEGANTLRVERQFADWQFTSAGYLYSKLTGDADFGLNLTDSSGTLLLQDTVQNIVLERESHVGNINALFGPWQGGTISLGVQGEWTRQNGTLEDATQNYPLALPTITNAITDIDRAAIDENLTLRYTRLPFTTLFAEARLQQEWIEHAENVGSDFTSFSRDTDARSDTFDILSGFDTSPRSWLKFGSHYRWRDKSTTYDDGFANTTNAIVPDPINGYPTFISARDMTTQEIEARLTVRPYGWLKTTLTYRLVATDYHTTTEPASDNLPNEASPGGRLQAGNYDAHIYSLNFTLTPWRRLHWFTTVSYQDVSSVTIADSTSAVVPYKGDTWSLYSYGRYVLTARTDLIAGYTFSTSDFQQNNFSTGLPLGMKYHLHGVQAGLVSHCKKNLTTKLQYGFYNYTEPSSGGANDYTAHVVFASLNWRLN